MKIRVGRDLSKRQIVLIFLGIVVVVSLTAVFVDIGRRDAWYEDEAAVECIDYVRRDCCLDPDLDRCQEDEVNWNLEGDPYQICC